MSEIIGLVEYEKKQRWFDLPVSSDKLMQAFDVDEDIVGLLAVTELKSDLQIKLSIVMSTSQANYVAEKIQDIPEILLRNASMIIRKYFNDLNDFLENYDRLAILKGCTNERELGNMLYQGRDFTDDEIGKYFDFERLARDDMAEFNGMFLDGAYIHQNQ